MIRSVVSVVMGTNGAFSYTELLNMELAEFNDVMMELKIKESAERIEETRKRNHENAVARRA